MHQHPSPEFLARRRGLGLVEVMVSVAIVGTLLAVATPSLLDLLERRRVAAVALDVANILSFARSEANNMIDGIAVHLEKDPKGLVSCASVNILHVSDFCKCYLPRATMCKGVGVPVLQVYQIKNADGVSFEATASDWGPVKERLTFRRNVYFTSVTDVQVNVKGKRTGAQLRVEMNTANRIRTCTPDGSISGFPACSDSKGAS
ncbi:MAG: Tfp pilus assembly protein FimT/FimU [Roseateles sp.]